MQDQGNKRSKSNSNCCVFGCTSVYKRNNISFHHFPPAHEKLNVKDSCGYVSLESRRKIWEVKLKMGKPITKNMRVCQKHFTDEDYLTPIGQGYAKRYLKKTAIPSQNLPERNSIILREYKEKQRQERVNRLMMRRKKAEATKNTVAASELNSRLEVAESLVQLGHFLSGNNENEVIFNIGNEQEDEQHIKKYVDCSTQTDDGDYIVKKSVEVQVNTNQIFSISDFINTDKALSVLTGIASPSLLNFLIYLLIKFRENNERTQRLTYRERVLLVFMKIKLDLTYSALCILFKNISVTTCKRIFNTTVQSLASSLKVFICLPPKENVQMNLPICFKKYSKVRLVLDCTEIRVQSPKKLCCRIKFYSHYKKNHTLKFMTAVTPGGLISYVSPAYGGRVSDKAIFEQSGLLEKLEPYVDYIMVDKGFLIENICDEYGIGIIRPSFLKQKKQFGKEESIQNRNVSAARVHVERANARIKNFRLFRNTFPLHLISIVDDIFITVCAIVNLSNPIMSDDRFLHN